MNPYSMLGAGVDTPGAAELSSRLAAWHDEMVAHERELRSRSAGDRCGEECPHAEARMLWAEALDTFGGRAQELIFLRTRAARDS
jgi:hypothetical protein